ncbi:MAG: glyceraldehyde-3-phosphate dehydrogenase, type I [Parcubacteria group bacterium LiPW_15]|nr:MAG: glyceraldehyde-3-phosphate dehydrogenase, type I [Parcubacteria group bacterium LiPW_15]
MAKIAINGFGRIGRLLFRQAFEYPGLEIVAINDLGDIQNLAYLLKYDTVYGRFDKEVHVEGDSLVVGGKKVKVLQMKDPANLPWGTMGVDIAVEATGFFESFTSAKAHLDAGAKRVVITAPAKDAESAEARTVLMGVNEKDMKTCKITSNGSCTTNAASPVIQIMSEEPGIQKAFLSTVHGYTATQNLVDGPVRGGKDFRRGRAAAQNTVPSTTGAAISVTRAIPELEGKFDGISFRTPNITGSLADITFVAKRNVTAPEINDIFKRAAKDPRWQGILKVTEDQLVSSDIIGEPYGAIVDLTFTKVIDGNLVKVLSWYDNEAGYVATLVKHILSAASAL